MPFGFDGFSSHMIKRLKELRRTFFDVREGELGRTLFLGLYLLFVLFAYYILKPVSRSLFVNKFDLDKLPLLYILVAPAGGILAYFYSRLAIRASLTTAVNAATGFAVGFTVLMGYLLHFQWTWTYYVFNVWVSMFSIMMVTQGWVIAANVFTTSQAKRLYGILGLGAVIGAGFGGTFTSYMVRLIGENNLIMAAGVVTVIAYLMYRGLLVQPGVNLSQVRGSTEEEAHFSLGDIARDISQYRHLQVIVAIVLVTFIVDVTVEYQFQAFAKARYQGADLTAFMGSFNGVYLNLVNFVFQFFLTAAMVKLVGVGGVLQIMPVTISIASLGIYLAPGVLTSSLARLSEAATRYTFNRTGMELLYLPLPLELRNRVKAFLDIFVDRLGRGIGGILLYLFTVILDIEAQKLSLVVLCFTALWSFLSWRAQREYLRTIRKRLEARSFDFEGVRISVNDPAMIQLLETTAAGNNGRQAAYALSLLASTQGYDVEPLLRRVIIGGPEVRSKVFELAKDDAFLPQALAEIRASRGDDHSPVVKPAVQYALSFSPDRHDLMRRLLEHPSPLVTEAAAAVLVSDADEAKKVISPGWVTQAASSSDPHRRKIAATALRVLGDESSSILQSLLADGDVSVAENALATAAVLKKRAYLDSLVQRLGDWRLRGAATEALAAYGSSIVGTLGDLLRDTSLPLTTRSRIPRILERIQEQRAADELLSAITIPNLTLRGAVIRSIARLRGEVPRLNFGPPIVDQQILEEAKNYFSLWAALAPFTSANGASKPVGLLRNTLEERLKLTLERMFYLLGIRYSPEDMKSAYFAIQRRSGDEYSAAIELLDSVLEKNLKRFLMPLLDDPTRLAASGKELFGIEQKDAETALRELIRSGDMWLVSCAVAAAADLKIASLKEEVSGLLGKAGPDVDRVVEQAVAGFA